MKYFKFAALLFVTYFLTSYINDNAVGYLVEMSTSLLCVAFTLGIYYGLFLWFRGTLRWFGRQLNYDRNNGR